MRKVVDYLGCVVLKPVRQCPSRPSGSCPHARRALHLWQSYRRHALGSAARPKAASQTSERQGAHPGAACWPQLAAPQILTWSLQRTGGSLACSGMVSVQLAGARLTTWYSGVDGTHTHACTSSDEFLDGVAQQICIVCQRHESLAATIEDDDTNFYRGVTQSERVDRLLGEANNTLLVALDGSRLVEEKDNVNEQIAGGSWVAGERRAGGGGHVWRGRR